MNNNPLSVMPKNEWDAFISSIIRPYYSLCKKDALLTEEDLQQEAWLGLLAACKNYDPTRSKFTTFAYHYIHGSIRRFVSKRTTNKPTQLEEDVGILDDHKQYQDETCSQRDLMNVIMKQVSDQEYSDLLIEHFVNDKSFRQIAKERGVSHETIAQRVHRLLNLLEIRLKHENA